MTENIGMISFRIKKEKECSKDGNEAPKETPQCGRE
jgi:hypothetical protein